MNYFVIFGPILVAWAAVVSVLGLTRPEWPGDRGRVVLAISLVLFLAAVGSAILSGNKLGERKGPEKTSAVLPG